MSAGEPLLALEGVTKVYGSPGEPAAAHVLGGVDLRMAEGEAVSITGPSGSGKSTLLNIMAALDRPTAGRVLLEGRDLSAMGDAELAGVRRRRIGLVFQLHHLLPQCTVLENVLVPTLSGGGDAAPDAEARARALLERVGLADRLDHRPGQLSGGERQRVACVRALINRPGLVLADEPTGALDRAAADNVADLLVRLNRDEGVALVVATHAEDLARRMPRILHLRDGTLHDAEGRP